MIGLRRLRLAVGLASLLVLVSAGCGSTTSSGSSASPAQSRESPTGSLATPVVTAQPSDRAAAAGTVWERRAVWFENPEGLEPRLNSVIHTSSGFVAWGPTEFGSAVLTSPDGLGWARSDSDQAKFDGMLIYAMAESAAGIVAIGIHDSRFGPDQSAPAGSDIRGVAHVWRSTDGGAHWEVGPVNSGIDGLAEDVVGSQGGFVAVGSAKGGCDVAVWLSNDGFVWQRSLALTGAAGTCVKGEVAVSPSIGRVRVGSTGLVAFGSIPGVGGAFWTSADGVDWTLHPQPSMEGGPGVATLLGFAAGGPGYIAVGTSGWPDAAVWTSIDGGTWLRVPDQTAFDGAFMAEVVVLDDGRLVAVGQDATGQFASWTSDDGLSWRREQTSLNPGGVPAAGVLVTALATDGRRAVAVSGGSWEWTSPPVSAVLRAAEVLLTISSPVDFRPSKVSGTCDAADDGSTDTQVTAAFSAPPAYRPNDLTAWIAMSPTGALTAFNLSADGLSVAVGQGAPIDPATFTVMPGSTADHGRIDFRGVTNELDLNATKPLAGSFEWTCDG